MEWEGSTQESRGLWIEQQGVKMANDKADQHLAKRIHDKQQADIASAMLTACDIFNAPLNRLIAEIKEINHGMQEGEG